MTTPVQIGIIGNGWRAQFFHRSAAALPEQLQIVGVVARSAASAEAVTRATGARAFSSLQELVDAEHPEFVVLSAPREVAPALIEKCVELGLPVLTETPPADGLDDLLELWRRVGASGLVQVAEQYLLLPSHAARRALVESGIIGERTSALVSSTHDYHAVSLIRGMLGLGFEAAQVRAQRFTSPLANPLGRHGWRDDDAPVPTTTTLATLDFGGRVGSYDFTENNPRNPLRSRRILVRGSLGELSNDSVVRLTGEHTILESSIVRRTEGHGVNLDGFDTDHLSFDGTVLWRNPFQGLRFSDEDIAISQLLMQMGAFSRDEGPAPYSLAQASQDHAIGLAIHAAVATGESVSVAAMPWAGEPVA